MPDAARHSQDAARRERQDVQLAAAAAAIERKQPEEAERWLARAGQGAGAAHLDALVRGALLWSNSGDGPRAVRAWQAVLRAGDALVEDSTGLPQRSARMALLQIARLVAGNEAARAEADKQAKAIRADPDTQGRAKVLNRLAREMPFAPTAQSALADEARAAAKAGRFERSAWWWGWLVATLPPGKARGEALAGLAATWEKMRCLQAARLAWGRLAREQTDRRKEIEQHLKEACFQPRHDVIGLPLLSRLSLTLPARASFLAPPAREGPGTLRLWSRRAGSRKRPESDLICRDRQTGEVRWRSSLGFEPTWLQTLGHLVIAAGPQGVAALDGVTGERFWTFDVPPQRLYPESPASVLRVPRQVRRGGPLGAFHTSAEHLVFVQGGRSLLALDVLSGALLWRRYAPGAALELPAPSGRIHHVLTSGTDRLLVQASGEALFLDAANGRPARAWHTGTSAWPRRPVCLPDGTSLVVPDSDRVECLDPHAKKTRRWVYTPPGKTTRSGVPPRVVAGANRVVVVVPENLGLRLVRLDLDTGKVVWRGAPLVDVQALDADSWTVDARTLFHAEGSRLWAWSLADGKLAWRRDLPESAVWRLERSGETLLVYPARCRSLAFRFRWLMGWVQWQVGPWPDEHDLAVLCMDARSGELVQRLNVPLERAAENIDRSPDRGSLFPWMEAGLPSRGAPGPVVWWDKQGVVLGVGRQVRCADADKSEAAE
jgi:outer membrane protein assembly factor BamB